MPTRTVLIHVGPKPDQLQAAKTVEITPTSTPGDTAAVIDAIVSSGLQPSDFRTRVQVAFDCDPDVAIVTYAALCGFAGRRLDVITPAGPLTVNATEQLGADALEQHRNAQTPEHAEPGDGTAGDLADETATPETPPARPLCIQIGADHPELPAFTFNPEGVTAAHQSKRVRYVPPADTHTALGQVMVLAAVRVKDRVERFPFLSRGDEPVGDDPCTVAGIDVDGIRRAALSRRRTMRADDRSTLVTAAATTTRQHALINAAATDIDTVLRDLFNAAPVDHDGQTLWPCPRHHAHPDTSSATLTITDNKAHCPRCDIEPLDSLRLTMSALRLTADEACTAIDTVTGGTPRTDAAAPAGGATTEPGTVRH